MNQKVLIATNVVLAFAVLFLYVLYFGGKTGKIESKRSKDISESTPVPAGSFIVAYINMDSMMLKYELYNTLKSQLEQKQSSAEGDYSRKMKQLENDYYKYQEKAQKGLLTRSEMQEQEMGLQQRQQEMQQLNQKLSEELAREEQNMQIQLFDSLKSATKIFNKGNRYQLIINNALSTTIVSGNASLNVTDSIVEIMNTRYKSITK